VLLTLISLLVGAHIFSKCFNEEVKAHVPHNETEWSVAGTTTTEPPKTKWMWMRSGSVSPGELNRGGVIIVAVIVIGGQRHVQDPRDLVGGKGEK